MRDSIRVTDMADVTVRTADFDADYAEIRRIRFIVFVDEQKVPAEVEMDDRDAGSIHVLAYAGGEAVGTGRIDLTGSEPVDGPLDDSQRGAPASSGRIGRVAVLPDARRRGVGSAIMQALHAVAAKRGADSVWCHAQVGAADFYLRLGYRVTSEPFLEAGIEHVGMEKRLR